MKISSSFALELLTQHPIIDLRAAGPEGVSDWTHLVFTLRDGRRVVLCTEGIDAELEAPVGVLEHAGGQHE